MTEIPRQLRNSEFRFVLLSRWNIWRNEAGTRIQVSPEAYKKVKEKKWAPLGKAPFEKEWQKNGYSYGSDKLLKHIAEGKNFGVIGGYGNLRILDIDDKPLGQILTEQFKTFTIETGSGGRHFYFISPYNENHVLVNELGELRAHNYQVVCPPCKHPSGNQYKVVNDIEIREIKADDLKKLIEPYLRKIAKTEEDSNEDKPKDTSGSGLEYRKVVALLRKGKSKKEIFDEMMKYTKWATHGASYPQYRENTYNNAKRFVESQQENQKQSETAQTNPEIFFAHDKNGKVTKFIPKTLGDFILQKYRFKTIKGNDKQIYYYKDGYYKENGIALIRNFATTLLDSFFKDHYVNEVVSFIRNSTYIEASDINHNWTNLKNGLLNPITKEFKEHTPDIFTLKQSPINYDPNASCSTFKEKLKERCDEDWKYKLIQEMFGYCFLTDNRFEKAFLFHGDPRTMKSTVLYILMKLLGERNITAMSLQYLTEDKHGPAFLYGTPANICADLSSKELRNTATFLKITGQDSITAGKKFEQEITFQPFTKLIFSCNVIPATRNKNMAFFRRWCPIEFNKQTPDDKIDPLMREKLLQELPGILNWALEGLDRILKNNKLTFPLSDLEVKDIYEKGSDSIQSFIYNEIDCEDDDGSIKKRVVYKKYKEYCQNNKLNLENPIIFGRRFFAITGCGTKRIGTIPGYTGVSLINEKSQTTQPKNVEKQKTLLKSLI